MADGGHCQRVVGEIPPAGWACKLASSYLSVGERCLTGLAVGLSSNTVCLFDFGWDYDDSHGQGDQEMIVSRLLVLDLENRLDSITSSTSAPGNGPLSHNGMVNMCLITSFLMNIETRSLSAFSRLLPESSAYYLWICGAQKQGNGRLTRQLGQT